MVRLLGVALLLAASPLAAQSAGPVLPGVTPIKKDAAAEVSREAPVNGVLTLYGNQRCPTDNAGNEIVVCVRRSASEQFRVPKELREFKVTPQNESWAARLAPVLDEGQTPGVGTCTTVGPAGGLGCINRANRAAKAEKQEQKADAAAIP